MDGIITIQKIIPIQWKKNRNQTNQLIKTRINTGITAKFAMTPAALSAIKMQSQKITGCTSATGSRELWKSKSQRAATV